MLHFFRIIIQRFDCDYWTSVCGLDGYLFLLFQKKLIQLSFLLFIASSFFAIVKRIAVNNHEFSDEEIDKEEELKQYRTDHAFLEDDEMISTGFWIHSCMTIVCTLLSFYVIMEFKEEAKSAYVLTQK